MVIRRPRMSAINEVTEYGIQGCRLNEFTGVSVYECTVVCMCSVCVCVLAGACGRACVATKDARSFSSLGTKNVDIRHCHFSFPAKLTTKLRALFLGRINNKSESSKFCNNLAAPTPELAQYGLDVGQNPRRSRS